MVVSFWGLSNMPIARFEMPDGRIARYEVPAGTTPEQAQTMFDADLPNILKSSQPNKETPITSAIPQALGDAFADIVTGGGDALRYGGVNMAQRLIGIGNIGDQVQDALGINAIADGLGLGSKEARENMRNQKAQLADKLNEAQENNPTPIIPKIGVAIASDPLTWVLPNATIYNKLPNALNKIGTGATYGAIEGATRARGAEGDLQNDVLEGAVFGGAMPAVGAAAKYVPYLDNIGLAIKSALPASKKTAEAKVTKRLDEILPSDTQSRQQIFDQIKQGNEYGLTPAQLTSDDGLISAQNLAASQSPDFQNKLQNKITASINQLNNEMMELQKQGAPQDAIDFVADRAQKLISQLDEVTNRRQGELDDVLTNNMPTRTSAEIGKSGAGKVDDALRIFEENIEKPAWERVPNTKLKTTNIANKLQSLQNKTPTAQQQYIPDSFINNVIKQPEATIKETGLFNEFGLPITKTLQPTKTIDVNELQGLRSELLDMTARAKASGFTKEASITSQLAEATLEDLGAVAGNTKGEAGELLRAALNATRTKKETFNQGAVGDALRWDRDRGRVVADELILDKIIGAGRNKGSIGLEQLLNAAPEAKKDAIDYILKRYQSTALSQDGINFKATFKFLRENEDVFNKLPEAKQFIDDITKAQIKYTKAHDRQRVATDALLGKTEKTLVGKQRVSLASQFINGDAQKAISRAIASNNPKVGFDLFKMVNKDNTGKAQVGMRSAMINHILDEGKTGRGILDLFNDKQTISVAAQILPKEQIFRVKKIANTLAKVEAPLKTNLNIGNQLIKPDNLLEFVAGYVGLKAGRKLQTGTIQMPATVSNVFKKITNKLSTGRSRALLEEAILDSDLFLALTSKITNPAAGKKFNAWLSTYAGRAWSEMPNNDEENNQPALPTPNNPQNATIPREPLELEITPQSYNTQINAPRGIRNNNPSNLKGKDLWLGKSGVDDDGFIQFKTPQAGLRAMAINLVNQQKKHGINSVSSLIKKYAPSNENDTVAYIEKVSNDLGVRPNQKIKLNDKKTMFNLMQSIIKHENGNQPYSKQELLTAINAGVK